LRLKALVQSELLRLLKRGNLSNANDNVADPSSDALWAEFDALEGALV
jgi:hypothetical protein